MQHAAEIPFEDEILAATEAEVEAVILKAGSARAAVRALLADRGELSAALEAARSKISLGYERGMQPKRPAS